MPEQLVIESRDQTVYPPVWPAAHHQAGATPAIWTGSVGSREHALRLAARRNAELVIDPSVEADMLRCNRVKDWGTVRTTKNCFVSGFWFATIVFLPNFNFIEKHGKIAGQRHAETLRKQAKDAPLLQSLDAKEGIGAGFFSALGVVHARVAMTSRRQILRGALSYIALLSLLLAFANYPERFVFFFVFGVAIYAQILSIAFDTLGLRLPVAIYNAILEIEKHPDRWASPDFSAGLVQSLERIAVQIEGLTGYMRLGGDSAVKNDITELIALKTTRIRELKLWVLKPRPDTRARLLDELESNIILALNNRWFEIKDPEVLKPVAVRMSTTMRIVLTVITLTIIGGFITLLIKSPDIGKGLAAVSALVGSIVLLLAKQLGWDASFMDRGTKLGQSVSGTDHK